MPLKTDFGVSWWGWGFSLAVWSNQSSEGEHNDPAAGKYEFLSCLTADSSRAPSPLAGKSSPVSAL